MFLFNNWITLSLLAGLASNGFAFMNRYLLKDNDDPVIYAWYFEFLRSFILFFVAIFEWKLIINSKSIIIFTLMGLSEWIGIYWYMKMHSYSHLSISSILSRTRLIWIAVLAFVLVGEKLRLTEYLGIVILFLGLSIAVAPNKLVKDKGARYASIAAFMIALNVIFIRMALPYASNSVINILIGIPSILLFPFMMKKTSGSFRMTIRRNIWLKSFAIIINVASVYLFAAALRIGETSKVSAIYHGMLIVSVLSGIIFLNERENIGRKLIGAAVTIIGVLLLA